MFAAGNIQIRCKQAEATYNVKREIFSAVCRSSSVGEC